MKYLIMLMSNPSYASVWEQMSAAEIGSLGARHRALHDALAESGELVAAHGMDDVALTRRVTRRSGDVVVSDGPMAEAKEHLAGFYLVDCSYDRAVEIAAATPDADWGEVLVRPVLDRP